MANASQYEMILKDVYTMISVDALKDEQRNMIESLVSKKDCMAVLPTGYGKSLPYQMYVPLMRRLKNCEELSVDIQDKLDKIDINEKIIVCCPLVSLMNDQVKRLADIPDLRTTYKGSSQEDDEQIKNCEVDVIFASPETLVGDAYWRSQLQKLTIGIIVIDEFHTITTWGGDEETSEHDAFGKWFRHVWELRALFPKATVLALSATCTNKIKKHVTKVLNMRPENTTFISISPNKSNIKLVVKKVDNAIKAAMFWLVDSLEQLQFHFPKTLIYANSISDVSKLYSYVVSELTDCSTCVEMFHSETPDEKKKSIIQALCHSDSEVRVVFATTALGMGIDVIDCNCIVLYGPPSSVLDLVQEIGRFGRDGKKSAAILMYNSYHLRVSNEVKQVFGNSCRRKMLMNNFLSESDMRKLEEDFNKHTGCDVCSDNCECGECVKLEIEKLIDNIHDFNSHSDTVDYEYNVGGIFQDSVSDDALYADMLVDEIHEINEGV